MLINKNIHSLLELPLDLVNQENFEIVKKEVVEKEETLK